MSLRVSNDSNAVVTATVDTVTEYVQGAVKATSYASDVNTITVTNFDTGKATSYDVSKSPSSPITARRLFCGTSRRTTLSPSASPEAMPP